MSSALPFEAAHQGDESAQEHVLQVVSSDLNVHESSEPVPHVGITRKIGLQVREELKAQQSDPDMRGKHNMTTNMLIELAAQRGAALILERIGLGMISKTGDR